MNKAVLVLAHKDPEQINMLIKQLLHDANGLTDIYIHLDKKNEGMGEQIIKDSHVKYIANNSVITWGDESMVRALLKCFKELLQYKDKYEYLQICTGQDLMIKKGLDAYLDEHRGTIYLDTHEHEKYVKNMLWHNYPKCFKKDLKSRVALWLDEKYVRLSRHKWFPKKKINLDIDSIKYYTSYNWGFYPFEVIEYISNFAEENTEFMKLYNNSKNPEDGFLGLIIMNSKYSDRVIFKPWVHCPRSVSLTYLSPVTGSGCHFSAMTMNEIEKMDESDCFMARKFDINQDREVVKYYYEKVMEE